MVALARRTGSQQELADQYGVTQPAIAQFKKRHKTEIDEIARNADDEFAGIALAKQTNRLSAYDQVAEKMKDAALLGDEKAAAAFGRILRNMAEELGALPTRVQLQGDLAVRTTYTVNGVAPEDLT